MKKARGIPVGKKFGLENYQYPDKFGTWLGYKLIRLDRKKYRAEVGLDIREDHLSPAKRVHGGVVSSFMDYAFGAAVFSSLGPRDFCSTVELKINYLKPIDLGDRLVAKTEVIFRGKRLCVLHGYLYRKGDKAPVAMGSATFNIVSGGQ
ncbi:MAG: PaaI family thioesterase [Bdellovibrio sp.]|nr:PaaI family thioesterase [Bdellovibrio sp.]